MNTIKTPVELAEARQVYVQQNYAEYAKALAPVLERIKAENLTGRCRIRITLGEYGLDRWSWHIGEELRRNGMKVTQKKDGKTNTDYLEVKW